MAQSGSNVKKGKNKNKEPEHQDILGNMDERAEAYAKVDPKTLAGDGAEDGKEFLALCREKQTAKDDAKPAAQEEINKFVDNSLAEKEKNALRETLASNEAINAIEEKLAEKQKDTANKTETKTETKEKTLSPAAKKVITFLDKKIKQSKKGFKALNKLDSATSMLFLIALTVRKRQLETIKKALNGTLKKDIIKKLNKPKRDIAKVKKLVKSLSKKIKVITDKVKQIQKGVNKRLYPEDKKPGKSLSKEQLKAKQDQVDKGVTQSARKAARKLDGKNKEMDPAVQQAQQNRFVGKKKPSSEASKTSDPTAEVGASKRTTSAPSPKNVAGKTKKEKTAGESAGTEMKVRTNFEMSEVDPAKASVKTSPSSDNTAPSSGSKKVVGKQRSQSCLVAKPPSGADPVANSSHLKQTEGADHPDKKPNANDANDANDARRGPP